MIILVIKQIGLPLRGRPILLITRIITDRIGLHSVLLPLLISLNVTYSNAIRLLFLQTMTSLTLTPGSRSAANAVGHVIFY